MESETLDFNSDSIAHQLGDFLTSYLTPIGPQFPLLENGNNNNLNMNTMDPQGLQRKLNLMKYTQVLYEVLQEVHDYLRRSHSPPDLFLLQSSIPASRTILIPLRLYNMLKGFQVPCTYL